MSAERKYRLIIADDEYLVRMGLRETIDWESLNIEIVAECVNGKQALEQIRLLKPDLVISDVRMPVMDGLQLITALSEDNFDGAVIMYSGYSDFEYVQKALDKGVSGYVLKPIENEKFTQKVLEVLRLLEEKRKRNEALKNFEHGIPYIRENFFNRLIAGEMDEETLAAQSELLNITLPQEGMALVASLLNEQDESFCNMYRLLTDALQNFRSFGYAWENRFLIVTGLTDETLLDQYVEKFLKEQRSSSISIGISGVFGKEFPLLQAVIQAKNFASDLAFPGVHNVKSKADASAIGRYKPIIADALKLISEHYSEKISVKWAAEQLFVSESHLMHEFKTELNKTFNDCVKDYRITKAKELLSNGKLRINEVAEAVGFVDVRYFGLVFKESTGKTPREYKTTEKK